MNVKLKSMKKQINHNNQSKVIVNILMRACYTVQLVRHSVFPVLHEAFIKKKRKKVNIC